MGGKGSGRRPGEVAWGDGEKEVVRTTRQVVPAKNPIIAKLDRELTAVDDMDVAEYVRTAFGAGADALWVFRTLANGEELKVGVIRPDTTLSDDVEAFILSTYGGPGTFVIKCAIKSPYGGYLRVSKNKRVRLGVATDADAGMSGATSQDASTIITRALAREEQIHALNKIKELNREHEPKGDGGEMKPEELLLIVRELKGSDKTSELLLEMLRQERERIAQMATERSRQNPLELLAPLATPLFGFLDKKLSPGAVGKWIEALRNPPAEAAPETFWSGLSGLLREYAPVVQPLIANLMAQMTPQPNGPTARPMPRLAPVPTAAPTPPQPTQPGGDDDMATRDYDDPDTKEMMDYVVPCLDEHKFPEVFAALRSNPDTQDVIAGILPGADPMAFWFSFRDLDERLRTRKDVCLEFIAYVQQQIQALIAAQQAAAAAPVDSNAPPAA